MVGSAVQRENMCPRPVNSVEITSLIDNYVDVLLENTDIVTRPPLTKSSELPIDALMAEHGLSVLVKTEGAGEVHSLLLDTGYNSGSVIHNVRMLEVDVGSIEAIVLSHAHMDHLGGLFPLLQETGRSVPLIAHPGIFESPRSLKMKDGRRVKFPQVVSREQLEAANVSLMESEGPILIGNGTVLVTGQVERITDFEKGMPNASVEREGALQPDHMLDDQSLILHLENKGLVLITGCCHAGIVNTVHYARKLTGIQKVYGIFGGFHLTGGFFKAFIDQTIEALREIDPEVIVPMHCTGWDATKKISEAFPDAFLLNSVGSRFVLN